MKKYLGSEMTAYAAIIAPFFIFGPLLFGIFVLTAEISGATVFLALLCASCAVIWGLYIKSKSAQLYSWGYFNHEGIQVRTLFSGKQMIEYKKCRGCGIGYYIHGVLNSNAGTKIFYIFFSYDAFDESYRTNMNLWKPSKTQVKVEFSKELYYYLLEVLSPKQSARLSRDYEKYIV